MESDTARAAVALGMLREVLGGGAQRGANPNGIRVTVKMNPKKDEGKFATMETVLGLAAALALSEKEQKKTEAERLVSQLDRFIRYSPSRTRGRSRTLSHTASTSRISSS